MKASILQPIEQSGKTAENACDIERHDVRDPSSHTLA
jgi:hypothetical protein